MPLPRAAAASLLALAVSACTWSDRDAVKILRVDPARGPDHLDVALRISGSGFESDVQVDFDRPGHSAVASGVEVTLVSGGDRIALTDVALLSPTELRAILRPGAPRGTYAVEVRAPRGTATLAAAFEVFADTAPSARLGVSPGGGTADATIFTLDASGSTDAEDPLGSLEFRFDSDGTGAWSAWSSSPFHAQTYGLPGVYTAAVEVRDTRGFVATATVLVVVAAPGTVVPVTTAVDELNPGATPAAPGGTGLSLREAIAWVNAQGTARTIAIAAPFTATVAGQLADRTLTAPGAAIVGEQGVVVDFAGLNQTCITLDGPGQRLVGLTLRSCDSAYVVMTANSGGSQVAQVTALPNPVKPYWAYGIDADSTSATTSLIGPGNDLSGLWMALKVDGANYEVFGNRVHDNALGAKLSGSPMRLWQNRFTGGVMGPSLMGIGVDIANGPGPVELLQNVFDGNDLGGLQAAAVASLTVRNNLFTANGSFGLSAQVAGLVHDHNGYFANASGPVSANLTTGATDLLVDPLYVDAAGGDLRLLPLSPAIDAGIDTGLDLNGTSAGRFSGPAPDLGATEVR